LHLAETREAAKGSCLDAATFGICTTQDSASIPSQKVLSKHLDAAIKQRCTQDKRQDPTFLAHLVLCNVPGAGAWLTASLVPDGRAIDAPFFQTALQRRLRSPLFPGNEVCPCCGDAMDMYGDHAWVCQCNGDRTTRHNSLRNITFAELQVAAARPEREKTGLLPGRPGEEGLPSSAGARHPADIWVRRGTHGDAEALDLL